MTRSPARSGIVKTAVSVFLLFAISCSAIAQEVSTTAPELKRFQAPIRQADREHWSFRPVARPTPPAVRNADWARNPIDRFVLAKLEEKGWKPAPAASPQALLRRVYLDLIGLPPTPEEQNAFLACSSPDALDRVVEELLSRPAYGERWARHWLDLARYADTNGYERDGDKPSVWRYRDYVIRAFNDDKPYDRFIIEQLAGDELPEANAETSIATGFQRLGPWDDEPADPQQDRFDQLDDIVSTTSQVFLGMTLGCARCHNHKFDPLGMIDYYRMTAVFSSLERPQSGRMEFDTCVGTPEEFAAGRRRDYQIARLHGAVVRTVSSVGFVPAAGGPFSTAGRFIAAWRSAEQILALRKATADQPRAYVFRESHRTAPTHILLRGRASRPGPEVTPGVPIVLTSGAGLPLGGDQRQGPRLALARWIASAGNPLTARVMVNRVWQYHFGQGLVSTPSDFGKMGAAPTHPGLLDWLADRFVRDGWSVKKLHRLILGSNTYRMSRRIEPAYAAQDPENRLLWRAPYHRLDVEPIHDSILAVSGTLNSRMFGPGTYPWIPVAALAGSSDPDKIWKPFDEREASRRAVYAFVKRSMIVPMFEVMDAADCTRSTAQRSVTSVAPQALTLFNGDFVNRQARHFARRLLEDAGPDPGRLIDRAFRLALCRLPSPEERGTLIQYLKDESAPQPTETVAGTIHTVRGPANEPARPSSLPPRLARALEQLCRVLFNSNEFVYPD